MELYEFWAGLKVPANQRIGQAYFNRLVETRPDLAEQIRGTDKDPFYAEKRDHPSFVKFQEFLNEHWY